MPQMVQQYFTKGDGMLLMPSMALTYAFSTLLFTASFFTLAKKVWKLYLLADLSVEPSQTDRTDVVAEVGDRVIAIG